MELLVLFFVTNSEWFSNKFFISQLKMKYNNFAIKLFYYGILTE